MALFDKLFSLKRRLDSDCESKDRGRSCQINPEQVRLLLFKECDWRGRKLLFDSSSIQRVAAGKHDLPNIGRVDAPCVVEVTDGYSYVYKGPEADATVLGEMIFGAVAMNYKSVSLKIHIMDEPRRIMCTKVFCVPTIRRISRAERKPSDRSFPTASMPLNMPLNDDGVALSFSMDRGDSGFCDHSSYSSVGSNFDYFSMLDAWHGSASQDDFYSFHSLPGRKLSTSSNGSWQRRTFQNIATRFQLGSSQLLNVPTAADSQINSNSSVSTDSIASGSSVPQRKNKLGIAVLITATDSDQLDLVRKCLEHCPQLQSLVCRLRLAAMHAGARGKFVAVLHRAVNDAARWISDLIYGPRLQPLWLNLVTSDAKGANKLADRLLADLCAVLAVGDTKTTNFFISTLLTHVLTYHLGWVTTVSPYDTIDHQKVPSTGAQKPYNALWAQLSDLCGSIGFPPRAAKTIISGEKNTPFVNRLLSVLTYFLRCGDVKRTAFEYQESVLKETKMVAVKKAEATGLKRAATRLDKLVDCDIPVVVNTQDGDGVSSDVNKATLADMTRKLSTSAECGCSSPAGQKSTLRRNPTMMLSLKASSDSSLNSSVSEDSEAEQKVLFVLGEDEKLVGLKNKSINGKCVKKSSKIQLEPVALEKQEPAPCEIKTCKDRDTESPSKCCGQTLQHSKPIKHSGFKFEFDKYPQIVTNYMKSKNLEILDRHYIGKPGNLKLDNFQFDPTVVAPLQEEKCDACAQCRMMESLLQTPTNASEMEYMNDIPRLSEPQYAKESVVADAERQHREISPKTFVRRRKENVVVVNLIKDIKSAAEGKVEHETIAATEGLHRLVGANKTEPGVENSRGTDKDIVKPPEVSVQAPNETAEDEYVSCQTLKSSRLKCTKSMNNLNSLFKLGDSDDRTSEDLDQTELDIRDGIEAPSETKIETNMVSSNELNNKSLNDLKSRIGNELKILRTNEQNLAKSNNLQEHLELKRERDRGKAVNVEKERDRAIEVKTVSEFSLPELVAKTEVTHQATGFDASLLGGVTDHYVPDLILQGTVAKPVTYEAEVRRDLDITTYINKELDSPAQAVAIIGDTNTWEVRVLGRDCGSGGMSSLVGEMLDALPHMWRAQVPAHHCLSFLESKLRELCVMSKTLADVLMSTDFCDIATLTKSLNIDVNDVPLLLAVATTHTPQVATRYGISYR